ncbi:unnamed protein product [Bursaphelenchus okinawaensis]|uniref:TGF-beta family profile domain-containing protein n=1 Tax=Bursaphelenchus okinawaensis TaxID=465554 RepID=A0A811KNX2_9BILA|nr:unnamed protein product [Bursaphelenchus okinawaensis]CAG9106161.1 unnamed protein product [Bursaphelenchus okinawaensis]
MNTSFIWVVMLFIIMPGIPAGSSRCHTCEMDKFDQYKMFRQNQILNDLLKKLELAAKPNVTIDYDNLPPIGRQNPRIRALIEQTIREKKRSKRSLPSLDMDMSHLYETDSQTVPTSTFFVAEPAPWPVGEAIDISIFRLNKSLRRKYIYTATLHVYMKRPIILRLSEQPVTLNVYQRYMNGSIGDKLATKYLTEDLDDKRIIAPISVKLDGQDFQTWLEEQERHGREPVVALYAEVMYDGENLVYQPRDGSATNQYLEFEIFDMPGRSRRSTPNVCHAGQNETKCCLYDLIIDFEKVGWEFVIAPKRYNAYICNGDCNAQSQGMPLVSTHGSMTAKTQTDFFQCCHPKDYTGVTIVYVTESNQIWVKEVPGMVARKCGCA